MRFSFFKNTNQIIAPRLLYLILFFSGIVTLIITTIQIYVEYNRDLNAIDDQFKKIEIVLIDPLARALWFMNEDSIRLQLDGILNLRDIEYLELRGEENIFINTGKKGSKHTNERVFSLTHRNDSGESTIGRLTVVASKTAAYDRLVERLITILVSQAIKTFLVSCFIFLIVHHLLIKHISFISNYLKGIDIEKPHSKIALQRTPRRVKDELDQVVVSVNEMIHRQKDSYDKIEQVVKKRTSELTQRNEQLKKEREKAQKYFDVAGVMLIALNASGEISLINKQGCRLLKTSEAEAIGKNWFDHFLPKRKVDEVKDMFEQLMAGNIKPVEKYENPVLTSNGDEKIVAFNNSLLTNANGKIEGVLCSGEDISDRKRLEAQLLQAQKMESIGNLAGGIAHDFNNILSSVIGFTELALDDVEKGSNAEDSLREVFVAGKRAKELVKQILAFARQSDAENKPIQPSIIAKEVITFIRSSIPTTVEIRQEIDTDSLIMGNATQVYQVLMNIFTNAAHAMEDQGGILDVSIKDIAVDEFPNTETTNRKKLDINPGDYIEIKVSDTGVGISPEIIESIFEPYFTTKGPGEGTGMGLAMAHGIVESYAGKITVDSTPGKGTIFSIYLPITKKRGTGQQYLDEDLPSGTERILFVDDELPIAKMASQILERLGYQVTIRTSSVEALELFRAKPDDFDLMISDVTMPNMTGDKLAVEIMAIRRNIPVILCTGYSKKVSDETAKQIGIAALIYKPIVKADLAKTIREVLDVDSGSSQG